MKRLLALSGTLGLILWQFLLPLSVYADQPRDADSNAMVFSGAYSRSELVHKLQHGDGHHSASALQHDFDHFGITTASIMSSETINGTVTRTGNVLVDD